MLIRNINTPLQINKGIIRSVENFNGNSDDKFFEKCFAIDFQLEKLNENGANACTKGIFENGCASTKTYAIILILINFNRNRTNK